MEHESIGPRPVIDFPWPMLAPRDDSEMHEPWPVDIPEVHRAWSVDRSNSRRTGGDFRASSGWLGLAEWRHQIQPWSRARCTASWRFAAPSLVAAEER